MEQNKSSALDMVFKLCYRTQACLTVVQKVFFKAFT